MKLQSRKYMSIFSKDIPQNPVYQIRRQNHQRLEHYQKYYQNGTYERSRESGTEANYDMVDGLVNNQKNPAEVSDTQMNKNVLKISVTMHQRKEDL